MKSYADDEPFLCPCCGANISTSDNCPNCGELVNVDEDDVLEEAWKNNQIKRIDFLNEQYRTACKQEMMNDLINQFDLLLANENISDDKKDIIYRIIMDVLNINS